MYEIDICLSNRVSCRLHLLTLLRNVKDAKLHSTAQTTNNSSKGNGDIENQSG